MPNLLVFADPEMAERLRPVFDSLGTVLRAATAISLDDLGNDPTKVAAFLVPFSAGSNTPRIQVLGIASHSDDRAKELENWKNNLKMAWEQACSLKELEFLKELGKKDVEIWPTMPLGMWSTV